MGGSRQPRLVSQTRQEPLGFLVRGSAIEAANGLYASADVEAYVALGQLMRWVYRHEQTGWLVANVRKAIQAPGSSSEWLLLDAHGHARFSHAGNTMLPVDGRNWQRVSQPGASRQVHANYTEASGCELVLDHWCNVAQDSVSTTSHCAHARSERLYARLDVCDATKPGCTGGAARAWRCYARHTLSADTRTFVGGHSYCTRDGELRRLLERCIQRGWGAGNAPPEVGTDTSGGLPAPAPAACAANESLAPAASTAVALAEEAGLVDADLPSELIGVAIEAGMRDLRQQLRAHASALDDWRAWRRSASTPPLPSAPLPPSARPPSPPPAMATSGETQPPEGCSIPPEARDALAEGAYDAASGALSAAIEAAGETAGEDDVRSRAADGCGTAWRIALLHLWLGRCLRRERQLPAAHAALARAATAAPRFAEAALERGIVSMDAGRYAVALRCFESALSLRLGEPSHAHTVHGWLLRAHAQLRRGGTDGFDMHERATWSTCDDGTVDVPGAAAAGSGGDGERSVAPPWQSLDLHAALQVATDATDAELKRAYRSASLEAHPDKPHGTHAAFTAVGAAYETLRDPERRAAYEAGVAEDRAGEVTLAERVRLAYSPRAAFQPRDFPGRMWPT